MTTAALAEFSEQLGAIVENLNAQRAAQDRAMIEASGIDGARRHYLAGAIEAAEFELRIGIVLEAHGDPWYEDPWMAPQTDAPGGYLQRGGPIAAQKRPYSPRS